MQSGIKSILWKAYEQNENQIDSIVMPLDNNLV